MCKQIKVLFEKENCLHNFFNKLRYSIIKYTGNLNTIQNTR